MIRKECKLKDSNFSNARFVVRLITTQVLPNMAVRLEGESDPAKLKRILQRDIPIEYKQIRMINENLFDEDMLEGALERLDAMVGLTKVKLAIHQFVDFARAMNRKNPTQIERYPLKWSFVGNTGTGKSSVAEVLSEILKAMHLLGKGHTVEVKAEELMAILSSQLKKHDLSLSPDAVTIMYSYIARLCSGSGAADANARTMKELARTIRNIVSAGDYESNTISKEVVSNFDKLQSPRATRMGY